MSISLFYVFVLMYFNPLCFTITVESKQNSENIKKNQKLSFTFEEQSTDAKIKKIPGKDINKAEYVLEHENETYLIMLTLSIDMFSSYSVTTISKNGSPVTHKPEDKSANSCYYQGFVKGMKGSKVVANTCNGFNGYIMLPKDFLFVDTYDDGTCTVSRSDFNESSPLHFCGMADHSFTSVKSVEDSDSNFINQEYQVQASQNIIANKKLYIEVGIVVSNSLYRNFSSTQSVERYVKDLMNFANGFYLDIDMHLVLSHLEIWNEGDQIEVAPDQIIDNLYEHYVEQLLKNNTSPIWKNSDVIHILHNGRLSNRTGILGIALLGGACSPQGIGVDLVWNRPSLVALTLAHEIGHNLGMGHDGANCRCPTQQCLMSAFTNLKLPQTWSSCSKDSLNLFLNSNWAHCLHNRPDFQQPVLGSFCGNQVVEKGEDCDCGLPQDCNSACCDALTCKFLSGAVCDKEACCTNCQFSEKNTLCRKVDDECELPEHCTGSSSACPDNVHVEDGMLCDNDFGACRNGVCLSLTTLCRKVWGGGAEVDDSLCYQASNILGRDIGNCGVDDERQYIQCSPKNVYCGKLFCNGGQSNFIRNAVTLQFQFNNGLICRTTQARNAYTEYETLDSGLVLDGTLCGDNKVCNGRICQPKPQTHCETGCHNHGVCTNLGVCHCEEGWLPPQCKERAPSTSTVTRDGFLAFLCLFVIASIVAAVFFLNKHYKANESTKKKSPVPSYSSL